MRAGIRWRRRRTVYNGAVGHARARFEVVPERSTIVVEARSSLGPVVFEATHPTGSVELTVADGAILADPPPRGALELALDRLASGNPVYDAELLRRMDARRYPTTRIELEHASAVPGAIHRFDVTASVALHGERRTLAGTLEVELSDGGDVLRVVGEKALDVRAFGIASPSILMMRIYPDVRVHLLLEARVAGGGPVGDGA
jgi:hypothetical protein